EVRVTAAQDAIRLLRLSLPFENEGRNLLEIEGAPGQTPGRLGNQDAVVRRGRLEPLRGVHRIANDRVGALDVACEQAGDDLAGVDADAHTGADAVLALEVIVEQLDGFVHREGCVDGAFGVVLVGDGRP